MKHLSMANWKPTCEGQCRGIATQDLPIKCRPSLTTLKSPRTPCLGLRIQLLVLASNHFHIALVSLMELTHSQEEQCLGTSHKSCAQDWLGNIWYKHLDIGVSGILNGLDFGVWDLKLPIFISGPLRVSIEAYRLNSEASGGAPSFTHEFV